MNQAGLKPDETTFVSVVCACSHAGLVEQGIPIFDGMGHEWGLVHPLQHYACLVALLGRTGHLHDAYFLVKIRDLKPNAHIYGMRMRVALRSKGLKQPPGFSSVEVDPTIYAFVAGEKDHPPYPEINEMFQHLVMNIAEAARIFDKLVFSRVQQGQNDDCGLITIGVCGLCGSSAAGTASLLCAGCEAMYHFSCTQISTYFCHGSYCWFTGCPFARCCSETPLSLEVNTDRSKRMDHKALHDTFATFGTVLSCKMATDNNGQSPGYGFVQFAQEGAAEIAITQLNGLLINDKQVYVCLFVRRQAREHADGSPKFPTVSVTNLSETTTEEDLQKSFGIYGPITSAVVMRAANGNSRGFGFVNFENHGDAAFAVANLNGKAPIVFTSSVCKPLALIAHMKNLTRLGGVHMELAPFQSGPECLQILTAAVSKLVDALWCLGNVLASDPEATLNFKNAAAVFQQAVAEGPCHELYAKSLETSAKAPELHAQINSQTFNTASPGPSGSKKKEISDLTHGILGWVILQLALLHGSGWPSLMILHQLQDEHFWTHSILWRSLTAGYCKKLLSSELLCMDYTAYDMAKHVDKPLSRVDFLCCTSDHIPSDAVTVLNEVGVVHVGLSKRCFTMLDFTEWLAWALKQEHSEALGTSVSTAMLQAHLWQITFHIWQCLNLDGLVTKERKNTSPVDSAPIYSAVDEIEDALYHFSDIISSGVPNLGRLIADNLLLLLLFPMLVPALTIDSSDVAAALFCLLAVFILTATSMPNGFISDSPRKVLLLLGSM